MMVDNLIGKILISLLLSGRRTNGSALPILGVVVKV